MKGTAPAHRAAERAARESYSKLVAYLAARTGDVAVLEAIYASSRFAGGWIGGPGTGSGRF